MSVIARRPPRTRSTRCAIKEKADSAVAEGRGRDRLAHADGAVRLRLTDGFRDIRHFEAEVVEAPFFPSAPRTGDSPGSGSISSTLVAAASKARNCTLTRCVMSVTTPETGCNPNNCQ